MHMAFHNCTKCPCPQRLHYEYPDLNTSFKHMVHIWPILLYWCSAQVQNMSRKAVLAVYTCTVTRFFVDLILFPSCLTSVWKNIFDWLYPVTFKYLECRWLLPSHCLLQPDPLSLLSDVSVWFVITMTGPSATNCPNSGFYLLANGLCFVWLQTKMEASLREEIPLSAAGLQCEWKTKFNKLSFTTDMCDPKWISCKECKIQKLSF